MPVINLEQRAEAYKIIGLENEIRLKPYGPELDPSIDRKLSEEVDAINRSTPREARHAILRTVQEQDAKSGNLPFVSLDDQGKLVNDYRKVNDETQTAERLLRLEREASSAPLDTFATSGLGAEIRAFNNRPENERREIYKLVQEKRTLANQFLSINKDGFLSGRPNAKDLS